MTAYRWAVIGIHVDDAELTPVELFERYEDARESMLCRVHALVDESGLRSYIDDCGQDVDVYLGGKDCYYGGTVSWEWHVKPVFARALGAVAIPPRLSCQVRYLTNQI